MLDLAEHEVSDVHKYKNKKELGFFVGLDKPRMLFSCS